MTSTPQHQDFYFVVEKIDVVPELRVQLVSTSRKIYWGGGTTNMGGEGTGTAI